MVRLVIAEKPSVAASLAKVLGVGKKKDGFWEGENELVSWCVGHLVELASADSYDSRYSKWEQEDLPISPADWQYIVAPDTKKQFTVLQKLMHREDVECVINACDAGREGELIFRLVYAQSCCQKPVKRLWISSMEDEAIRKGWEHLLDGNNYDDLYQAALCRSKADWLVGINATRLFSCLYHKTLNIGRVMTPTLGMIVQQEAKIAAFQKESFYTVKIAFDGITAESERFPQKTDAQRLREKVLGKTAIVQSVAHKEKKEKPPKLFDLTLLQREANRLLGYTAQQTLDYAQALYEKKLLTYPRTDSNFLTEEMESSLPALLQNLSGVLLISEMTDRNNLSVVIDSSKVGDHHAILPTKSAADTDLQALPTGERKILILVIARLFCAVSSPERIKETDCTLLCEGASFHAKGRVILQEGWKKIWSDCLKLLRNKPEEKDAMQSLPPMEEGQRWAGVQAEIKEGESSPPKHFTEDTLLSAMETAGLEEIPEDAERKGLGTAATRAGIIEKLVRSGLIERKGEQLLPTAKGSELISILPERIQSAKLTAEWEAELKKIEQGRQSPEDFLANIQAMLQELVADYQGVRVASALMQEVGKCPRCGRPVYEGKRSFYCSGYQQSPPCSLVLWKNNRFFLEKQKVFDRKLAAEFLKTGRVKMSRLYSEKKGIYYDAVVVMQDTGEKFVQFKLEFPKKRTKES